MRSNKKKWHIPETLGATASLLSEATCLRWRNGELRVKNPSKICFVESGFCYTLNQFPPIAWEPFVVEEGDGGYANLLSDANAIDLIHRATKSLADGEARAAMESGIASALKAIEKRAGQKVKITLAE